MDLCFCTFRSTACATSPMQTCVLLSCCMNSCGGVLESENTMCVCVCVCAADRKTESG